jgi:hypothetical protein
LADRRDPTDDLLRKLVGDPVPTDDERARSLASFERAMAAVDQRPRAEPSWRFALAAVGLAVVAGVAFIVLSTKSAAAAELLEVARLVETSDPLEAPDGAFVYTQSDTSALMRVPSDGLGGASNGQDLYYRLPVHRESWIGDEGTLQLVITPFEPIFFADADRVLYFEQGIDRQDAIGETEVVVLSDAFDTVWATDQSELDAQIRGMLPPESARPMNIDYLDIALQVIRESPASPATRAAALRLMSDVDGLELTDEAQGVPGFQIEFEDNSVLVRWTFAIDDAGFLRKEARTNLTEETVSGIPAGAVTFEASYWAPIVVATLEPQS